MLIRRPPSACWAERSGNDDFESRHERRPNDEQVGRDLSVTHLYVRQYTPSGRINGAELPLGYPSGRIAATDSARSATGKRCSLSEYHATGTTTGACGT